jgi:digeranylgeranylglycerophospholipid reductase
MRMERPVGVIGASMAGLRAARYLAERGIPVTVYEAQPTFEPDPRTLIVTPAWLHLQAEHGELPILNRIETFELISRSATARVSLQEPDIVVARTRFLKLLARRATKAGAALRLGHQLESMERVGPAWQLGFRDGAGNVTVSRVLGADGVNSTVAQAVDRNQQARVAIVQARVTLPSDQPPSTVRVWFERKRTRFFYWLIPESAERGVAGLIAETKEAAREALEAFLSNQNLTALAYQAAAVPLHRWGSGLAGSSRGDVLLAGDAAGQVKVTTVGGVVTGMRGGLAAAQAWASGCTAAEQARPLRRELNAHALVRHVLDRFTDEDYDALLRRLNDGACRVLERYPRDELTRALWRLLLTQPRWLSLGARALVRSVARGQA